VNRNSLKLATPRHIMEVVHEPPPLVAMKKVDVPWRGLEVVVVTGKRKGTKATVKDVTLTGADGITLQVQQWGMAQAPIFAVAYTHVKDAK
jgi:hypothetical protein